MCDLVSRWALRAILVKMGPMAFTWVRPADPSVLEGRPLLDLGTGDGQTLATLVRGPGLAVGVDRTIALLRPGSVNAEAGCLPFRDGCFETVLAADLFHHLDDGSLSLVLVELARVLRPGGRLVAWWYETASRDAPDAPRYPRRLEAVTSAAVQFKEVENLALEMTLEPAPATIGMLARQ